jgi:hypothetical protein
MGFCFGFHSTGTRIQFDYQKSNLFLKDHFLRY